MTGMVETSVGKVTEIFSARPGLTEVEVAVNGNVHKAINYDQLTGEIQKGDRVVLNTTAVTLGLGTGGYHFVISNLSQPNLELEGGGHIMKLRYTPQQLKVLSIEEEASGYSGIFNNFISLNGFPVVIFSLHSSLAPVAISFKTVRTRTKVVYIMTDGAALPAQLSETVFGLKQTGYLDGVITAGNAFGGDMEAVNIYSALIAAKEILEADAAVVGIGPGNVGTGTAWGFSGTQLGEVINAVNILGGRPVFSPRISFADSRSRHLGISHHSMTVLTKVALSPAIVVFPRLDEDKTRYLKKQISENRLDEKHIIVWEDGLEGMEKIKETGFSVSTMGRSLRGDQEFFLAGCAAGIFAGKMSVQLGLN